MENIALKINVDIDKFDKVYLMLCKPAQCDSKHHGYFTAGSVSVIHLSYVLLSKNPDMLFVSA